jgi:cell wall-associated NlpC family hydrolase
MTNRRPPRRVALPALIVLALLPVGCATTAATTPPAAFPGAPAPPIPSPDVPVPHDVPVVESVVETALELLGQPYRLGGDAPDVGFDCSGLIRYSFGQHLIDVPRTVVEQFAAGRPVDPRDVRRGDLIFFSTIGPGATHVGIALGSAADPRFVHAPSTGGVVRVERFDSAYWRSRFVGVRRMF